jgi:hypothetical protein
LFLDKNISTESSVVAAQNQVSADLNGEAVILNLQSGIYFGLNPVGKRIWELLQTPIAVGEIYQALLEEYDVEPERCQTDLLALLQDLVNRGLVEVRSR